MNRMIAVAAATGLVIIAAGILVYRGARSSPDPDRPAVVAERPPAPPGDAPTTTTAMPTSKPAREASKPAATPRSAAKAPATPPETASETGSLHIVSDVPGAQVFIDRQFIGATPVTAKGIQPGSHQLNVSAQGYDGYAQTIDVAAGPREIVVNFREVRLDASIDVVHKHRIGSCKGRLVATAAGVRYETTDEDDAFGVPLLELALFQVDYLSKNLRLQPRGGKRYDFTDPDGNADRLFVFHRDVERARERLKKGE